MTEVHSLTITPDGGGPSSVASGWPPPSVQVATYDIAVHCCPAGAVAVTASPLGDGYTCPAHGFQQIRSTEPAAAIRVDPPPPARTITVGHGLVYVHRDGAGFTVLDRGQYRQTAYPRIPQPERDIVRALLVHALRELDAMDEADGGQGTVRG